MAHGRPRPRQAAFAVRCAVFDVGGRVVCDSERRESRRAQHDPVARASDGGVRDDDGAGVGDVDKAPTLQAGDAGVERDA